MNMSKWVGLFYKTNEQLNVSSFTRKPSSLKPCASPTTYGMQTYNNWLLPKALANWAKHKVRKKFEPRRSKRIKVQSDVPFEYAIENIIYVGQKWIWPRHNVESSCS